MVERAAVGVAQGLAELTDHVQPHLGREPLAVQGQVGVEPQVRLAVHEPDRRSALVLADLHGLRDAAMGDALQHLVLAPRGALGRLLHLFGGLLRGEVDPDASSFAHRLLALGEPIFPGRTSVEDLGREPPVVAEPQVRGRDADADVVQQLRQHLPREVLCHALRLALRWLGQQVAPDPRQACAVVVASVDADALHLVQR
jgi:hypothetical protein